MPAITPTETAYALADTAAARLEARDWDDALALSSALVQRWPDRLIGHHLLGVTTYYRAADPRAIAVPRDQIRLSGESGKVHMAFGILAEQKGMGELATLLYRTGALLDFHLQPALRAGYGGPLNGQVLRIAAVRALAARGLAEVVETGTHRGTTAEFLAQTAGCPVHTTETHPYYVEISRLRFEEGQRLGGAWAQWLRLWALDSRAFLGHLFAQTPDHGGRCFFYLDAHDNFHDAAQAPPLLEELALIRRGRRHCIVMIDDFVVPDDPTYSGIAYAGHQLSLPFIAPVLPQFDAFFLPIAGRHDTGARRGSVVLSGSPETTAVLAEIPELRRGTPIA